MNNYDFNGIIESLMRIWIIDFIVVEVEHNIIECFYCNLWVVAVIKATSFGQLTNFDPLCTSFKFFILNKSS